MRSVLALLSVVAWHSAALADTETREFPLAGIDKVDLSNGSGTNQIVAVDAGKAVVVAKKNHFDKNCKLTIEQRGSVLAVEVKSGVGFGLTSCSVDLTLKVPRSVGVVAKIGSGELAINGTKGDLDFRSGSGAIKVDAEVTKVDGRSGSGAIAIKGLTGGGSLAAGSAGITLAYVSTPNQGELDIRTGSGDASVTFPKEAKIKTSFKAGSGTLTNELGDTPDSTFQVSMKAGSGSLHIKKQ